MENMLASRVHQYVILDEFLHAYRTTGTSVILHRRHVVEVICAFSRDQIRNLNRLVVSLAAAGRVNGACEQSSDFGSDQPLWTSLIRQLGYL